MVATLAASSMLTFIPEAFDELGAEPVECWSVEVDEGDSHPGREEPPRTGRDPDAGTRKGDLNMP
jgi:hypothetical protein